MPKVEGSGVWPALGDTVRSKDGRDGKVIGIFSDGAPLIEWDNGVTIRVAMDKLDIVPPSPGLEKIPSGEFIEIADLFGGGRRAVLSNPGGNLHGWLFAETREGWVAIRQLPILTAFPPRK